MDTLPEVLNDARNQGAELADLLAVSRFSKEAQEAFASLIPYMTLSQMERLRTVLLKQAAGEVGEQMEDVLLSMKAAQMKYDFASSHAERDLAEGLQKLEQELERANT